MSAMTTGTQRSGKAHFAKMRGDLGCALAMLVTLLTAVAITSARAAEIGDATQAKTPADDPWLITLPELKSMGVRSHCKLPRVTRRPAREEGYLDLHEGIALTDEEARRLYKCVKPAMARGYAKADMPYADAYQTWTNYATVPYISATHAERYVNIYANEVARAYGAYDRAGRLPVGSVIAKDSFSVTANGRVAFGPLVLMEKVATEEWRYTKSAAPGAYPSVKKVATEEWRYTMIMPEGWMFGTTGGLGDASVRFCAHCHGAVAEDQDHLYFPPSQYRRQPAAGPEIREILPRGRAPEILARREE
jgi:hypothetical protein